MHLVSLRSGLLAALLLNASSKFIQSGNHLSLFTIVKFPNCECIGANGASGTCYSASECSEHGGQADGTCAQGFGICCLFNSQCGSSTTQNITYLNLNQTTSGSCNFEICPLSSDVCKLRLDFESFTLTGPLEDTFTDVSESIIKDQHSIIGTCLNDNFVVAPAEGPSPPLICGENTGQHMYVSLVNGCATVSAFISSQVFTRRLSIKTSQILCGSEPPQGCLQWLTGVSGMLSSFNNGGTNTHLTGQDYTSCVRREQGYCSICWAADTGSFQLSLQSTDGMDQMKGVSEHDNDCGREFNPAADPPEWAGHQDYIEIPQGRCVGQGADTESVDRYCGELLACVTTAAAVEPTTPSTVCSSVVPFQIRVFTDEFEAAVGPEDGNQIAPDGDIASPQVGFKMFYEQMRCT